MKIGTLEPFDEKPLTLIHKLWDLLHDGVLGAAESPGFREKYREADAAVEKYAALYRKPGGYVYVLVANIPGEPLVKIGFTEHLTDRLTTLGIQIPFRVAVGMVVVSSDAHGSEAELHRLFKEFRHNGEWFYVPQLKDVYAAVREAGSALHFVDTELMGVAPEDVIEQDRPLDWHLDPRMILLESMNSAVTKGLARMFPNGVPEDVQEIFRPAQLYAVARYDEFSAELEARGNITFDNDGGPVN